MDQTETERALAAEVERLRQREREVRAALGGYPDSDLVSLAYASAGCCTQVAIIDEVLGERRRPAESVADAVRRIVAEA